MVRSVSFGEKYISQKKGLVEQDTFKTYERFLQNVKTKDNIEVINFGEEEVESDHEVLDKSCDKEDDNRLIFKQCSTLKKRIDELINTDIS